MNIRSYKTHTKHQPVCLNNECGTHITGMKTVLQFNTSVALVPAFAPATLAVVSEGVCIYFHTSLHQET